MCDFDGKLIAWMDRELPAEEAARIECHVDACAECRARLEKYERVSVELDAFCDEFVEACDRRAPMRRWLPTTAIGAAAAVVLALFLAWPRPHAVSQASRAPEKVTGATPLDAPNGAPAPAHPVHRAHRAQGLVTVRSRIQVFNAGTPPAQNQRAYVQSDEPVIQIAIPADEMFPPGAVPAGVNFAADLTISADGTVERLRLHPRLAGFERRTTEP